MTPDKAAGAASFAARLRSLLAEQDLWAGLLFVATGCAALLLGRDLNVGSAADMGEGFVPIAMAIALVALGAMVIATRMTEVRPFGVSIVSESAVAIAVLPAGHQATIAVTA